MDSKLMMAGELFTARFDHPYFSIIRACTLVGYPYVSGTVCCYSIWTCKTRASVVTTSFGGVASFDFLEQPGLSSIALTDKMPAKKILM
jgi:hypothetical protein